MNVKINLLAVFFLLATSVLSQNTKSTSSAFQKKNSLNLEIGGYTGVGTIFYERVIINNQKYKTTGQIGYGIGGIPIIIHELISFNNNHLELGLGILFPEPLSHDITGNTKPFMTGRIGYRYQKPEGSFVFRVGLMPFIADDTYGMYINDTSIWTWPGISFGYAF
jgi:hypothetical protein